MREVRKSPESKFTLRKRNLTDEKNPVESWDLNPNTAVLRMGGLLPCVWVS